MDGKSEKEVLGAGGKKGEEGVFVLPPSPPVKHHFRGMVQELKEDIHGLLHPDHKEEREVVQKTTVAAEAGKEGYPRIFEDVEKTKTMEVGLVTLFMRHFLGKQAMFVGDSGLNDLVVV